MSSFVKQSYAEVQAHISSNPRKHILKIALQKSVLAENNIVNKVTPIGENGT